MLTTKRKPATVGEIDALSLTSAAVPSEHQPPLLVDADRVKPRQVAAQLLEMIAGRHAQILIGRRVVDHLELTNLIDLFPSAGRFGD